MSALTSACLNAFPARRSFRLPGPDGVVFIGTCLLFLVALLGTAGA